jgi:hypothetical protein
MKVFVNDLILITCVKPTEMRTCENILTTSGYTIEIKFTYYIGDIKNEHGNLNVLNGFFFIIFFMFNAW